MLQPKLFSDIFSSFARQSQHVYFIFNPATNQFLFLNPAFSHIWEHTHDQITKAPSLLECSLHPDDKSFVLENYQQIMEGEGKQELEFRIVTPGGTEKWICISVSKFTASDGTPVLAGTAEDISKKKQYVDNLLKFAAKKNSVLEILAHDLAGPLNVLQSMAGLLANKVKPYQNPELEEFIGVMADACKRNVKLIREFVANELLESSEVVMNKQRINIVERLQQTLEEYKNSEEAISKNFEFTYSNDPIMMEIDDTKFMQVINNLFSNAIKFTPDQGTISLSVEDREDTVFFVVADTGIGIPAHLQPVLFDKFSKARRPGLRGEESTGLGMSIIKTLVDWHGGNIWFESEVNKGTKFFIELPKE